MALFVGDVIQMISGEQEFQSLDQTTYDRVPKTPPSPSVAQSRGQGIYGRDNPSSDSQTSNELTGV